MSVFSYKNIIGAVFMAGAQVAKLNTPNKKYAFSHPFKQCILFFDSFKY